MLVALVTKRPARKSVLHPIPQLRSLRVTLGSENIVGLSPPERPPQLLLAASVFLPIHAMGPGGTGFSVFPVIPPLQKVLFFFVEETAPVPLGSPFYLHHQDVRDGRPQFLTPLTEIKVHPPPSVMWRDVWVWDLFSVRYPLPAKRTVNFFFFYSVFFFFGGNLKDHSYFVLLPLRENEGRHPSLLSGCFFHLFLLSL